MIDNLINRIRSELISIFKEVDTWFDVNDKLLYHRPANSGWTVREILEHITLTNYFLLILIKKGTAKALATTKDADYENQSLHYDLDWYKLQQIGGHNSFEWNRPAHMEPSGTEDLLIIRNRMQAQLKECLQYLTELKNGEGILYKTTMTVNGLGKIDMYHYIYFLAQHARRHLGQMERVKNEFI
jgi:hypothetical protein